MSSASTLTYSNAQMMMTLCAISYAGGGQELSSIKGQIKSELSKQHYATGGDWELVWGPARTTDTQGSNLMFITKQRSSHVFAVVLRGTLWSSIESWVEDVPTSLVDYPWAEADHSAKVSREFLDTVKNLVALNDPGTGISFSDFIAENKDTRWFVTGHSQGGGLAPMMHGYLATLLGHSDSASFTFAAPTSGNSGFAGFIDEHLNSTRTRNPHDVVPYGYGDLPDIWEIGIPVKSIFAQGGIMLAVSYWQNQYGLKPTDFAQPQKSVVTLSPRPDQRPDVWYEQRVESQHISNSYLLLMDAPQVELSAPSPLMNAVV
jgi:hypothetical protein